MLFLFLSYFLFRKFFDSWLTAPEFLHSKFAVFKLISQILTAWHPSQFTIFCFSFFPQFLFVSLFPHFPSPTPPFFILYALVWFSHSPVVARPNSQLLKLAVCSTPRLLYSQFAQHPSADTFRSSHSPDPLDSRSPKCPYWTSRPGENKQFRQTNICLLHACLSSDARFSYELEPFLS